MDNSGGGGAVSPCRTALRGARCDIRSVRVNACDIGRRKHSRSAQTYGLLYTRRVPGFHSPDRVAVSVSTVAAVASG
nr:hypothetical protein GCM10017611_24550 [Rhodococcus wratislaviensis]